MLGFLKTRPLIAPILAGSFKRSSALRRGGYYFHLEPGNSFVAGGFWGPNKEDLLHIRKQLQSDYHGLGSVVSNSTFQSHFGELLGEQLKTAPRGFEKDDPAIEYLRYKQFLVKHNFEDRAVLKPDFAQEVNRQFEAMRPFFDLMSDILTTDLNGEPLFS